MAYPRNVARWLVPQLEGEIKNLIWKQDGASPRGNFFVRVGLNVKVQSCIQRSLACS